MYVDPAAFGSKSLIGNVRHGSDNRHIEFPFKAFLDDLIWSIPKIRIGNRNLCRCDSGSKTIEASSAAIYASLLSALQIHQCLQENTGKNIGFTSSNPLMVHCLAVLWVIVPTFTSLASLIPEIM